MTEQDKPGPAGKPRSGDRKPRAADKSAEAERVARETGDGEAEGSRIAKLLARAGVASRREIEKMVAQGRIKVNGKVLESPAVVVSLTDRIEVDGQPVEGIERTRLWIYHKPAGLVTTNRDPEGRPTVFERLPSHLPRVVTVGRLDINTEGLLLLTNDGGLARALELPSTGWLRRYRVRAHGEIDQEALDRLKDGIAVDGVLYGAIEATLDRKQGHNVWLTVGLREGKNREVKNVLGALGLEVNRLIRVSFGPFQLGDLPEGEVIEIRSRTLREQLGPRMIEESGANFDAPLVDRKQKAEKAEKAAKPAAEKPAEREWISSSERKERARARLSTRPDDRGGREDRKAGFGGRKPFDRDERPPRDRKAAGRDERKPFDKGERKPFARDRGEGGKEAAPARRPGPRSRAANVWMAPGARPVVETKKASTARRERPADEAGAKKPKAKTAPRRDDAPRRSDTGVPRRKPSPAHAEAGERRRDRDEASAPKRKEFRPRREDADRRHDGEGTPRKERAPRKADGPRPPRADKPGGKPAGGFGKPGGPRGKAGPAKSGAGKPASGKSGSGKPGAGGPRRGGGAPGGGKGRGADRRR